MYTLGTTFTSSIFPGRAPAGHVTLTTFLGGSRRPQAAGLPDSDLLQMVRSDLERLAGVSGNPVFTRIHRFPLAIPQYEIGYGQIKDAVVKWESDAPGLVLAGTYRDGVSVANAIVSGGDAAERCARFLERDDAIDALPSLRHKEAA
jgi:oxygen-dependent protoporphyrinogen oxidase